MALTHDQKEWLDKQRVIAYKPHFAKVLDDIKAAILLQQIVYRFNGYGRAIYKFKEPCSHDDYRIGDSWIEELNFSKPEFDRALSVIGTKCKRGMNKTALYESTAHDHMIIYWTDSSRVTWYDLNRTAYAAFEEEAYEWAFEQEKLAQADNARKEDLQATQGKSTYLEHETSELSSQSKITQRLPIDNYYCAQSAPSSQPPPHRQVFSVYTTPDSTSGSKVDPPTKTDAEREFFTQFHRKRWATQAQAALFRETEQEVGSDRMMNAVTWAAQQGISNVKAICTAARKNGNKKHTRASVPSNGVNHSDYLEHLRRAQELGYVDANTIAEMGA